MSESRPPIGKKFRIKGKIYVYDKGTGKMVEKRPDNEMPRFAIEDLPPSPIESFLESLRCQ